MTGSPPPGNQPASESSSFDFMLMSIALEGGVPATSPAEAPATGPATAPATVGALDPGGLVDVGPTLSFFSGVSAYQNRLVAPGPCSDSTDGPYNPSKKMTAYGGGRKASVEATLHYRGRSLVRPGLVVVVVRNWMSFFGRETIRYRDGTIAYRYYMCNPDGSWRRQVETWTTSFIAEAFFCVPITEENQVRYDFCPEHDNVLVGYILECISGNLGCTNINWDVISNQWNESTRVGLSAGAMELWFKMLKQMYDE